MTEHPDQNTHSKDDEQQDLQKPNLLQVAMSVLSAIFGVQSSKNRERDFKKGDPANFIGVYIVIVVCIIVGMMLLVNSVIKEAGL